MERDFAMTKRKRKVSLYSPVHKHEPEGRSSVGPHSTSCMYRSRASKMYCALRMRTQGCFYVGPRVGSHRIIAAYKYMYNVHVFFLYYVRKGLGTTQLIFSLGKKGVVFRHSCFTLPCLND